MSFIKENSTDPLKLGNMNITQTEILNVVKYRYYDIEEILTFNIPNESKSLSMFHINTCSLSKNFDDLKYLLKNNKNEF